MDDSVRDDELENNVEPELIVLEVITSLETQLFWSRDRHLDVINVDICGVAIERGLEESRVRDHLNRRKP